MSTPRTRSKAQPPALIGYQPADKAVAEDQVRLRAYELYQERLRTGTAGDPLSDWFQAESAVRAAPGADSRPAASA